MEETEIKSPTYNIISKSPNNEDANNYRSRYEKASFKYICKCKLCYLDTSDKFKYRNAHKTARSPIPDSKGFTWLLRKLGEASLDGHIILPIPDTAVFKNGRPNFMLQFSHEKGLQFVTSPEKLKLNEVIKKIQAISKLRKREVISESSNKLALSGDLNEKNKEMACLKYMNKDKANDIEDPTSIDEDGSIRIMNENEFSSLLWQRYSSNMWKTLAYIQSVFKCKNSIGESEIFSYTFSEDETISIDRCSKEEKDYNFNGDLQGYFRIFTRKIYYYLEKYANVKMKQIQAEFVKDENNTVWMVHAKNIEIRKFVAVKKTENLNLNLKRPVEKLPEKELLEHLEKATKEPKNVRTEKIMSFMKDQCEMVFKSSKILENQKTPVEELNEIAYKKLKPLSNLYFKIKSRNHGINSRLFSDHHKKSTNETSSRVLSSKSGRNFVYTPLSRPTQNLTSGSRPRSQNKMSSRKVLNNYSTML